APTQVRENARSFLHDYYDVVGGAVAEEVVCGDRARRHRHTYAGDCAGAAQERPARLSVPVRAAVESRAQVDAQPCARRARRRSRDITPRVYGPGRALQMDVNAAFMKMRPPTCAVRLAHVL